MNYSTGDTALFVLSTGENILGVVKKINSNLGIITLENPVYLVPVEQTAQNPQGGLQSMAYLMFSDETFVDFESKDVRHYLTPKEDIAKWYNDSFSVIKTPPEKKIIVN